MKKYVLAVTILSLSAATTLAAENPNLVQNPTLNFPTEWEPVLQQNVELNNPNVSLENQDVLGGGVAMEGYYEPMYEETSIYNPYPQQNLVNLYLDEEVEVQLTEDQVGLYGNYNGYDFATKEAAEQDLEWVEDGLEEDVGELGGKLKVDYRDVYQSYDYYEPMPVEPLSGMEVERDKTYQNGLGFSVEDANLKNLDQYKDAFQERDAYVYETIELTNRQRFEAKKETLTNLVQQVSEEKEVHNEYLKELADYSLGDLASFYLDVYPDYQTLNVENMTVKVLVSLSVSYEIMQN